MPSTLPASPAVLLSCPKVTTGKSEKREAEAVAEIEEMGKEANVPVNAVLLQGILLRKF